MFKQAVKYAARLRLAIAGPSGGGKTYTALAIASHLGRRIALVDTEHGSASKYADMFTFDVLELRPPFHPDRFCEAIRAAAAAGYDVLILDSLTHAWNGEGGLLDLVDEIARRMKTSNTFAAWKDATPIQNRLIEAIVGAELHVIATMRSKQDYVLESVERNGRTVQQPKKVGMAPVQRDSMEYEFDVFLDMDVDNNAIVQKTRCPQLAGRVFAKPGADVAGILQDWLGGQTPTPVTQAARPAPAPVAPSATANGNGNGHTPPPPAGNAPAGLPDEHRIADLRASLEANTRPTLASVASAAAATGLYTHDDHALQAMKGFPFPDGVKAVGSKKVSREGALKVFDWLMARKAGPDAGEFEPAGPDVGDGDNMPMSG